jgi:hypothetical protein
VWSRNDDENHSAPAFLRAWFRCRDAVGLHFLAESYVGAHGADGLIDVAFIASKLPQQEEREEAIATLVDVGLWQLTRDEHVFEIVGYLERNPSAEQVRALRATRAAAGRAGARRRWDR